MTTTQTCDDIRKGRATVSEDRLDTQVTESIAMLLEDLETDISQFRWLAPDLLAGSIILTPTRANNVDDHIGRFNSTMPEYDQMMRPIKQNRVRNHAKQMIEGDWNRPVELDFAVCDQFDSRRYVAENGNHRRRAVMLAGQTPSFEGVRAVVNIWVRPDVETIRKSVCHYDTGAPRTAQDINMISGSLNRHGYNWTKGQQSNMRSMLAELMSGMYHDTMPIKDMSQRAIEAAQLDWAPVFDTMCTIRENAYRKRRHGHAPVNGVLAGLTVSHGNPLVNALMAITLRSQPEIAERFWTSVYENSAVDESGEFNSALEEAITTVSSWLKLATLNTKDIREYSSRMKSMVLFRRMIQLWNAYARGKQIPKSKLTSLDDLKNKTYGIAGTPLVGDRLVAYTPNPDRTSVFPSETAITKKFVYVGPYDSDFTGNLEADSVPHRHSKNG